MNYRQLLMCLLAGLALLPMGVMLLLGTGALLAAMGDDGGAAVLKRLSLALGLLWAFLLLGLVLVMGIKSWLAEASSSNELLDEMLDEE